MTATEELANALADHATEIPDLHVIGDVDDNVGGGNFFDVNWKGRELSVIVVRSRG